MRIRDIAAILAEDSVDIIVARCNEKFPRLLQEAFEPTLLLGADIEFFGKRKITLRDDTEPAIAIGPCKGPDEVHRKLPQVLPEDRDLFVPIGVKLWASLLHQDARE